MDDVRSRIHPQRIPDSVRRALYATAGPLVTLLATGGLIPGNQAAAWTSLVIAGVTLLIAVVNSESQWRNAVYLATAALQGYGIGTDATWAAISGIVVSLLGIGLAAAFTPSGLAAENRAAPPRAVPVG